jgi:cytochrome c1
MSRSRREAERWRRLAVGGAVATVLLVGCARSAAAPPGGTGARLVPGGDAARGRALIHAHGCGACHFVPGVPGARGRVAPTLAGFAGRTYIAGGLVPNTPERLVAWIHDPQALKPGTAMPAVGVGPAEAADMAAYLYTLD